MAVGYARILGLLVFIVYQYHDNCLDLLLLSLLSV